jgi:mRNA interferase MazF
MDNQNNGTGAAGNTGNADSHDSLDSINRGDIYYASLGSGIGCEQSGHRPVIVVQNDSGNAHAPTVIVVPVTSRTKTKLPTHLPLSGIAGIRAGSVALMEQVRTIDKSRLGKRIGSVHDVGMGLMDAALAKSLDLHRGTSGHKPDLMSLCKACADNFEDSGYTLRRAKHTQQHKEPCTYCNKRTGFDYWVSRP